MAYNRDHYNSTQQSDNGYMRFGVTQGPSVAQPYSAHQQQMNDGYSYDGYNQGYEQEYRHQYQQQQPQSYQQQPTGRLPGSERQLLQDRGYIPSSQHGYHSEGGRTSGPDVRERGGGRGQMGMQFAGRDAGHETRSWNNRRGEGPGRMQAMTRGGYDGRNAPRGGYGQSRTPMGQASMLRPPPPERTASSDPGPNRRGPPLAPPTISPIERAWDNPFPDFPTVKRRSARRSEEQSLGQQLSSMDLNNGIDRFSGEHSRREPSVSAGHDRSNEEQRRPPTSSGMYGRASQEQSRPDLLPAAEQYGRSSTESQHVQYQPYKAQQPVELPTHAPPRPSYDANRSTSTTRSSERRENYASTAHPVRDHHLPVSSSRGGFDMQSRSNTMPSSISTETEAGNYVSRGNSGPNARYNALLDQGPPRPATTTGTRPPPHRIYAAQAPTSLQHTEGMRQSEATHQIESITDVYDSYFESSSAPDDSNSSPYAGTEYRGSNVSPNEGNKAGVNMWDVSQQQVHEFGGRERQTNDSRRIYGQSQSATYENASGFPERSNDYGRDQQISSETPHADFRKNAYVQPDQHDRNRHTGYGLPGQSGYGQQAANLPPQSRPDRNPLKTAGVGNNTIPISQHASHTQTTSSSNTLPAHPTPIRAGLIPSPASSHTNSKPPPIRQYNSSSTPENAIQPPTSQTGGSAPLTPPVSVTNEELEHLRITIRNNPNDQNAQLTLARKLVLAADILTPLLPNPKDRAKAREKYILDAHKLLKKLVSLNNPDATFYLADCYGRGALGLEPDNKEAFTLYQSAAKAGHAAAAYRTAVCCELGSEEGGGTRRDPTKAMQWYKRAATLGDTPAMYKMGMIQLKGLLGQPKSQREAVGWLKRAADQADAENPHALHELGLLYESVQPPDGSSSIIRDEAYSSQLFSKAAELGYKFSQFRLGSAYEYGLYNLPINPRLSIMWYSRAAVQEEHQSELALSGWYLTGSEVQGKTILPQSDTEAYLWARKAAMAGLAKAEYAMGYFTEVGIGAPADLESAKRWYWRAASQNFPKARERLEDLKRTGVNGQIKSRERISRSKVGKQNEGECTVM